MKMFLPLWVGGVIFGMILTLWFFWPGFILAGVLLGIGAVKMAWTEIANEGMYFALFKNRVIERFHTIAERLIK